MHTIYKLNHIYINYTAWHFVCLRVHVLAYISDIVT